ncbi:MAG: DUF5658 family protein [Gammaproteobacteria bacterium]|jgi:hypothetical protein
MRRISPPVTIPVGINAIPVERRDVDRRRFGWRTVCYGFLRSRRRTTRRAHDRAHPFSDWHHPWLFFLGVGVMLLSVTDAFFTLQLLDRGAIEMNPVMRVLIDRDTQLFVGTKFLMTGLGLLLLVYTSRVLLFRRVRVGLLITAFFCGYACLICYEYLGLLALGII